ncbi:uncharacterized protein mRpL30 [Palaemon carinicauda]|uniref:uncharacterized protein mRpL30 n=1 Tax=Palaemon carinicauda TaxID=392227 RepID=UPI0035B577DC
MLRQGILKMARLTPTASTAVRSCSSKISWSTGEKNDPTPVDCPLGNKGKYPKKLPDGGVEYFGFKYYPRNSDEVDPPYEPSPLHLVTRVRSLKGKPHWEKDIMKKYGLERPSACAIIKNNPENNAYLWKVKHLIKIVPIKLPKDLPEQADPRYCFLKETGELIYNPNVTVDEADFVEDEEIARTKICKTFIDAHTRKNWNYPWQIKLC